MKRKNSMKRYIGILAITMFASVTACSYVVDMVERSITKRASFSINATYDHATQTVTLSWDETGGGNFAGYEIYITEGPDDEYSGYRVVAAAYTLNSDSYFATSNAALTNISTQSYTYNVSNYISSFGAGRYFFRVGIIDWDENESDRTASNGYTEPWYSNLAANYPGNTDIDQISGLAAVDLYL
jgi:hypothetical protein